MVTRPTRNSRYLRGCAALLLAGMVLGLLTLPSCVTRPKSEEQGILASARRLLAIDFSRAASGKRMRRLHRWPGAVGHELRRSRNLLPGVHAVTHELRRSKALANRMGTTLAKDFRRQPSHLERLIPRRYDFAQALANSIDHAWQLLGPGQRPLNEIDDRVHRTDHTDNRPEKSLWQRILRRINP